MSAREERAAVPAEVERALLRALARAADAGMESPHGRNAERLKSRRLTAASIILSALSHGDTDMAHEALEALAPRKVRRVRTCGQCHGGDGRGCSSCGFTGQTETRE